ncbi:hypothetical protein FYJ24_01660 [Actinomycetaceae bacterium WB03_NA08]|uniref:Uncharacterized protein n=1 Tax=Scrofimicrobium canadense TaxID=2652290 RepID=A0A6N7VP59_9ACTO|nr:hypothetical protein [Scrofimicrobium canadense]MSS83487.1 hypothetical protein [Scrofimicrobium canadense]
MPFVSRQCWILTFTPAYLQAAATRPTEFASIRMPRVASFFPHMESERDHVTAERNLGRFKRIGFGFTNFNNYKTRVLLYTSKPHRKTLDSITIT